MGNLLQVATAFLVGCIAALVLTPVVRTVARRLNMVAPPKADRWHTKPTALMGGVAIYFAIVLGVLVTFALTSRIGLAWNALRGPALGVMAAATIMFAAGVADDRFALRPYTKLILQAVGAAAVISFGVIYPLTPWLPINVVATVFWFIAITNALNLLDNMDGVAAGVAGLAGVFLAINFALNGAWHFAVLCGALAGATAGFLRYNFHPASIFMGDSGSLVLGALIASLGAAFPQTAAVGIVPVLFVPVFIVIIPILDTLLVTTTRTVAGHPISMGGSDHTSHRLVRLGLSERQVALLLYAFAAVGGLVALGMGRAGAAISSWAGLLFLLGLGLLAVYLGRMHTYQPGSDTVSRRVTNLVTDLLHKRRALEALLDMVLFAAAYYGAYVLRWDGALPASQQLLVERTLALTIACKSIAFGSFGVYRGVWHHMTLPDLHRLLKASAFGSLLTMAVLVVFFRNADFARSILILDLLLATIFTAAARMSFRSLDLLRRTLRPQGTRALIYGAGSGGELLIRELRANPSHGLVPVGFIDDDTAKLGRDVVGVPILGTGEDLLEQVMSKGVTVLIVACRDLDPPSRTRIERVQSKATVEVWQFRCELAPFGGDAPRVSALPVPSAVGTRVGPARSIGPAEPAS